MIGDRSRAEDPTAPRADREVPMSVKNVVGLIVDAIVIIYLILAIKYPNRF
ncbi:MULTISPECIES: hypothetical protein [Kitasatospora]|uniref:Uncharacterized protein n=1 Tax=Kitasatospora setae (strain ATCC 33774 / DSM 43861 / JCM 3304 / KCC A-0304 / NBRC 14216 / KM-6054) TaxID=452652 RepID=E4N4I2_KITSK|nr:MULTISPECIES: hypothetical protein [Kitasatospora]BAJ26113.1 hypothetical protein KSE_02660 [Kitasatospora setae KM-6054]